jgi:hypothetical protein
MQSWQDLEVDTLPFSVLGDVKRMKLGVAEDEAAVDEDVGDSRNTKGKSFFCSASMIPEPNLMYHILFMYT